LAKEQAKTRSLDNLREHIGIVRGIDEETRTVTGYASVGTIDRYGEVVLPEAFRADLDRFLRDDHIFAANHRYVNEAGEPLVIGKVLSGIIDDKGLLCTFRFDTDPISEKWWQKYKSGTLKSFSIGFIPIASEYRKIKSGESERNVLHYTEIELLEISAVPIPANRESMVTASTDATIDALTAEFKTIHEQTQKQIDELRAELRALHNDMLGQLGVLTDRHAASGSLAGAGHTAQRGTVQIKTGMFS